MKSDSSKTSYWVKLQLTWLHFVKNFSSLGSQIWQWSIHKPLCSAQVCAAYLYQNEHWVPLGLQLLQNAHGLDYVSLDEFFMHKYKTVLFVVMVVTNTCICLNVFWYILHIMYWEESTLSLAIWAIGLKVTISDSLGLKNLQNPFEIKENACRSQYVPFS